MTSTSQTERQRNLQHFTLYIANGRIYARNVRRHLIDLGEVQEQAGSFRYLLDGDEGLAGKHLPNADAVLREVEKQIDFLFLDGQFTSLPDLSGADGVSVAGAPQREIALEEMSESDADPLAVRVLSGTPDTPHVIIPPGPPR